MNVPRFDVGLLDISCLMLHYLNVSLFAVVLFNVELY